MLKITVVSALRLQQVARFWIENRAGCFGQGSELCYIKSRSECAHQSGRQPWLGNPQSVRLKQVLRLSFAASFSPRNVFAANQNSVPCFLYKKAASPMSVLLAGKGSEVRDRYRPKLEWLGLQQLRSKSSSALKHLLKGCSKGKQLGHLSLQTGNN
jgi:hypothetical protein